MIHFKPITDKEFKKFSTLIFQQCGIFLKAEKKELLNARLGKRLRERGINSFAAYYDDVVNDASGGELIHLINSVSTNFTSFFREKAHFDHLSSTVLPDFIKKNTGERRVSCWSAACSSGEEPYTLSIVLNDFFESHPGWNYSILATDISTKVLSQARKGVYNMERVSQLPTSVLKNNFRKGTGKCAGFVKVKEHLQRPLTFQRFNLMDPFTWQNDFHVIFCRNVMIYFNTETQEQLVKKFYNCLVPGGYLFIGHSESLANIDHRFKQVATTAYQK